MSQNLNAANIKEKVDNFAANDPLKLSKYNSAQGPNAE